MHAASKAVAARNGELAWIDLWRGVLLCNVLDEAPVLRLLQWPVPPPRGVDIDLYFAASIRDATVSNGVIRFVGSQFDDSGAGWSWRATVWSRDTAAKNWCKCLEADISEILSSQTETRFSTLLRHVWADGTEKLDFKKDTLDSKDGGREHCYLLSMPENRVWKQPDKSLQTTGPAVRAPSPGSFIGKNRRDFVY
ncbi:hypothetical protein EJB05_56500, partial [Eragrostis curvula]